MNPLGIREYASKIVEKATNKVLLPVYPAILYHFSYIFNNIDWKALDAAIYKFSVERGPSISSPRAMIATMCVFALYLQHLVDNMEKESEKREKIKQEKITAGMGMFSYRI